ncbi:clip domain serine protease 4 isoform X1 [Bombyx mori]|uniref:CLIP domain-containing serine protease n=1 Tax=Bombyx mori TaxID=7091 RepID=A0A8R2G7X5_BOMMO|nr:clip domain serine protease 4 isoform X1 [Bombyx mori]
MRILCALLCFSLCTELVFCQFGFFQQRDEKRFSPFQFAQNLLPNPNRFREGINNFFNIGPRPIANENPNQYTPNQLDQNYDSGIQSPPNQNQFTENKPVVFPTPPPEPEIPNDQNGYGYQPDQNEEPQNKPVLFPTEESRADETNQEQPNENQDNVQNPGNQNEGNPFTENAAQDLSTLAPVQPQSEGYSDVHTDTNSFEHTTLLQPLTPLALPNIESRNVNFGPSGIFNEPCQTVENEVGSCLNLLQCTPYLKIVKEFKTNPAAAVLLRKAHCGFEGSNPKVCCPLPGFPTVPPDTTTTTTTTTQAPAPTQSAKSAIEDLVPAFPEPPYCGVSNASFSRVVGGVSAKLGDFPWMVNLGYKPRRGGGVRWLCGGSLITSRHVLTAAHCMHNHDDDLYLVRVGELDLARDDEGATPVDVLIKTKIKHEQYDAASYTNDIGILVLEKDVPITDLIKPICIPKDTELRSRSFEDYNPIIAGWGDTEFRGPSATHLQVLQLPVVSNDFCAQAYSPYKNQKIDERVLCAGYKKGGKDACQGDSGGPLMQPIWNSQTYKTYFYQIGVVSFGKKCAEAGFPGVYARVTHFVPWIQEKVVGHA